MIRRRVPVLLLLGLVIAAGASFAEETPREISLAGHGLMIQSGDDSRAFAPSEEAVNKLRLWKLQQVDRSAFSLSQGLIRGNDLEAMNSATIDALVRDIGSRDSEVEASPIPIARTVRDRLEVDLLSRGVLDASLVRNMTGLDPEALKRVAANGTPTQLEELMAPFRADEVDIESLGRLLDQGVMVVLPGSPNESDPPMALPNAATTDLLTDATISGGRLDVEFYRKGFREIGVIASNSRAEDGADLGHCTGTVISNRWVLTAAHCFTDGFFSDPVPLPGVERTMSFFVVDESGPECPKGFAPENCHFIEVPFVGVPIFHPAWQAQPGEKTDLALVPVQIPESLKINPAGVHINSVSAPLAITIAGFGRTLIPDERAQGLNVGFRNLSSIEINSVQWMVGANEASSTTCSGDSGGPLFMEHRKGLLGEAHNIVGITSGGNRDCGSGRSFFSGLSDSENSTWLCETVERGVSGCEISGNQAMPAG